MGPSHTQPHIHEENGAVEAAPCLRPLSPSGRRRRKPAACGAAMLAACALALALALAAPRPAEALGGISGTCYVACTNAHIDGPDGGNVFEVTFPEYGITATGYCISGSVYGTPLPGTYPFTGEPADDGGFQITVNCRGAGMYENHYSPYGVQNVGGFKLYPFGSVEVLKRSAAPEVTDGNPCYRLDGAAYGVYADEACTREALSLTTDSSGRARSKRVLAPGRYWVREKAAPEGYLPDPGTYPVDLAQEDCRTGAVPAVHVEDAPLIAPVDALVQKADRETGVPVPLGDASLAGAAFTVEHYAGRYASLEEIAVAGARPARTWDVITDEQGRATAGAGDLPGNGRGAHGLPLGTVVVREVRPPAGYLLPDPPTLVRAVEPSPDEPNAAVYRVPPWPSRWCAATWRCSSSAQARAGTALRTTRAVAAPTALRRTRQARRPRSRSPAWRSISCTSQRARWRPALSPARTAGPPPRGSAPKASTAHCPTASTRSARTPPPPRRVTAAPSQMCIRDRRMPCIWKCSEWWYGMKPPPVVSTIGYSSAISGVSISFSMQPM